jgi:glycerol kinase
MSRYVLALDQGTTSSRAILFDHDGRPAALAQREFPQLFPRPGWVEHDPAEIWNSQLACARDVMAAARVAPADVAAIGITNQRETTVVWERTTGRPIANAIVWQDRRTAALCSELQAAGAASTITARTGLLVDPYFSGTKIAWLLDNVLGARARAERGELAFGTVDTWLIWQLTGGAVHATDVSNASRTMLFNLHTLDWDDELLALLKVPRALLPRVVSSSGVVGECRADAFGAPVRIAGIAGDQQAATFGQACFAPGMAKNTYGTGCFMLMNSGSVPRASANRLLCTVGWMLGGTAQPAPTYCLEGSVFVGGAVVQWLRDGLGFFSSSNEIEALAAQVPDNGGVFLVPAFAGLGSPHWDPHARGLMIGMTRGTTRAHVARAALESIAFQSAEVLSAMQRDAASALTELRVDGGAARNDLLMQFQADLVGVPVVRPAVTETTALGAAYLAGLAVGFWPDTATLASLWRVEKRFEPRLGGGEREQLLAGWLRAVQRAKGWAT